MVRFDKCCCCLSLENGTIVIGVLSILGSILAGAHALSDKELSTPVVIIELIIDLLGVITAITLIIGVTRVDSKSF